MYARYFFVLILILAYRTSSLAFFRRQNITFVYLVYLCLSCINSTTSILYLTLCIPTRIFLNDSTPSRRGHAVPFACSESVGRSSRYRRSGLLTWNVPETSWFSWQRPKGLSVMILSFPQHHSPLLPTVHILTDVRRGTLYQKKKKL